jgi:UrcA family protein
MNKLIQLAVIAAAAFTIAQAHAESEIRSTTVRFAELDTNSSSGAAMLFARLNYAAKSVCRDLEPGRELSLSRAYAACVHEAIVKAVADIGRPALTEYAASHGILAAGGVISVASNK